MLHYIDIHTIKYNQFLSSLYVKQDIKRIHLFYEEQHTDHHSSDGNNLLLPESY